MVLWNEPEVISSIEIPGLRLFQSDTISYCHVTKVVTGVV